jgi:hypothetical protein
MSQQHAKANTACTYLESAGTASRAPLARASHRHRCMARGREELVAPRTQAVFCLTDKHKNCPLYCAAMRLPDLVAQDPSPDGFDQPISGS